MSCSFSLSCLVALTATVLSFSAVASDHGEIRIEGGTGFAWGRYSSGVTFDFLGQPFDISGGNMTGGQGDAYFAGAWYRPKGWKNWSLGLDYDNFYPQARLDAVATQGVKILSDPTALLINQEARRQAGYLKLAWTPDNNSPLHGFMALGVGGGQMTLSSLSQLQSDFLGVLQDHDTDKSDFAGLKLQLGMDVDLPHNFYVGVRSNFTKDVKSWGWRNKVTTTSFMLAGGYRFGAKKKNIAPSLQNENAQAYTIDAGIEYVMGSYDITINTKTKNALGVRQPLEFNTNNMFNGTAAIKQLSFWSHLPFADDFKTGLQYMRQDGSGITRAVISESGPLTQQDEVIDAYATIGADLFYANIAYMPAVSSRIKPSLGVGVGYITATAHIENRDPAQNVFTETSGTFKSVIPQVFFGLDYQLSERWSVGFTSRYMVEQTSLGLKVSFDF